jgi:hypothetical protein
MDRRCLRSAHDGEREGLVRVAAQTPDFQIAVIGVERVAERLRRLRRSSGPEVGEVRIPLLTNSDTRLTLRHARAMNTGWTKRRH